MADLTLRGQSQEAARLLQAHQPLEAMAICRRILQAFPKHIGTYSILGQACMVTGQYQDAADLFSRVLSADPENPTAHSSLATIHERWSNLDRALWHAERAYEASPDSAQVYATLKRLAIVRDPSGSWSGGVTRAFLARALMRGQFYDQAIKVLGDLLAADPGRLDLRVLAAEAHWHAGDHEATATASQSILRELPYCLKANLILGQLWLNSPQDELARQCLQKAQEVDPDNAVAQSIFGHRSPLPPRVPRLPFREGDAAPLDLPYVVDDEEIVREGQTIEVDMTGARDIIPSQPTAEAEPDEVPVASLAEAEELVMPPDAEEPAQGLDDSSGESDEKPQDPQPEEAVAEQDLSLLDVQHRYLLEHPEDYQAQLDMARSLRDMGYLEQALHRYKLVIDGSHELLPGVIRDLELLSRLYPRTPAILEVLAAAHQVERREPPTNV